MGRRASKQVTENGNVTLKQRYIYRGYLQIACCDLTRSAHPCLWLITWDPTQPVATRPLVIQKSGTWYCYGWDLTKNICEVFGSNGYINTIYTYTPYGEVTSSGSTAQPLQWSSEYVDTELGMIHYNYRDYNPIEGCWLSRDPAQHLGGMNVYAYVGNTPLIAVDNLGLWKRIENHVWCAEKKDTLAGLATKEYKANYNDWQCLWPVKGTKDHGYPSKILPGDKYDASNLASPCTENRYAVSVVKRFGEEDRIAFNVNPIYMLPSDVPKNVANAAKYGATPITHLHVSGHGSKGVDGVINDYDNYFTSKDLAHYNKTQIFEQAQKKQGPARCWFCRNAEVRLATCHSQVTALRMATHILRKGSIVHGTQHVISIVIDVRRQQGQLIYESDDGKELGKSPMGKPTQAKTWKAFNGAA